MNIKQCNCSIYSNLGDAAPRLWICDEHGKTGMIGTMMTIEKMSNHLNLSMEESWDLASAFKEKKTKEFAEKGMIYYDEDYLTQDLMNEYMKPTINIGSDVKSPLIKSKARKFLNLFKF